VCNVAEKNLALTEEVLKECRQRPKLENAVEEQTEKAASEHSELG
jgi:hypothetical protein